jgi:hypothetical protein
VTARRQRFSASCAAVSAAFGGTLRTSAPQQPQITQLKSTVGQSAWSDGHGGGDESEEKEEEAMTEVEAGASRW